MLKAKAYVARENDGTYSIYVDEHAPINYGLVGEGASVAEAIAEWNASYRAMKELYEKKGKEFKEAEFDFVYDVPSFLTYYGKLITFRGLAKLTGISASQLSQYATGYRHPSPKTTAKIETGLKNFASELSSITLC